MKRKGNTHAARGFISIGVNKGVFNLILKEISNPRKKSKE